jgi:hypothetical protein
LTDSFAQQSDNVRPTADAAGLSDVLSAAADRQRSQADPLGFTDSLSAVYDRTATISDALGISDILNQAGLVLRDLALASQPLATRWAVAAALARWAASQQSRWMTIAWGTRWAVQANINRFTTSLTQGDKMSLDIIISAGAAVYVGGTITEVTGKDISADTYQISLGSDTQPGTWLTPDVSTVGTSNAQHIVKLLVSSSVPSGLAKGTYWVWVKISDTPEIQPLRVQGPVNVR